MARCGHARPRAPRRAGGRLPRRPRRARPARRRSGPGPAARRVGRWSATPRPPRPRSAGGSRPSMASAATDLSPDDARALGAMRAGIETAFGPDAELPVAPRHRASLVRRRLGVGRGHRGRRNDPAGAPRGLLRDARGRPRGRRRAPGSPADPGPAGDRARRGEAATPVPGPRAAVAGDRRRRCPDRRARRDPSAIAVPGAAPGIARSLGGRRLPHRRQRAGARAGRRRRRAVGRRRPRGVAGRGDDARPRAGRAGGRAVGLVVAGR